MKKYLMLIILMGMVQLGMSQGRDSKIMEKVEAQKVAFFTQTLDLTVVESQAFWPIYNEYHESQKAMKKQFSTNFRDRNMTEEEAELAISNFLEMQEKEMLLKKQLYADLRGVIPASKMVKLQFAENQFKQKLLERIKKRRDNRNRKN